jgi:1-acyl-sn-glycerol-3-phosphate acyltransferase
MIYLRSLVFLLFELVVTPLYVVAVLLASPLPRIPRFHFITGWCRLVVGAARWICGIRYRVIGIENVGAGPYVVVAKHSSTWETLALSYLLAPMAYVAKRELLWLPFFGWGFALASPITIDRSKGAESMQLVAEQGRARLAQGFWIMMFPEGTRIRAGQRGKYKTGGTRLASMLNISVLPIAHNAGYLWAKRRLAIYPGTITVSIGRPLAPAGRDPIDLMHEIETWIEAEVERIGDPRVTR